MGLTDGTWKFEVAHFSTYGDLPDTDEDEPSVLFFSLSFLSLILH
jgi:hypothetical protein